MILLEGPLIITVFWFGSSGTPHLCDTWGLQAFPRRLRTSFPPSSPHTSGWRLWIWKKSSFRIITFSCYYKLRSRPYLLIFRSLSSLFASFLPHSHLYLFSELTVVSDSGRTPVSSSLRALSSILFSKPSGWIPRTFPVTWKPKRDEPSI